MEFTHEQISEIISEITNGEEGLQGLVKQSPSIFPSNTGKPEFIYRSFQTTGNFLRRRMSIEFIYIKITIRQKGESFFRSL